MAKLYSTEVEQKLLICALETRSKKIRAHIIGETDVDDYGSDVGLIIRKRIDTLLSNGKALGSATDLAEDPAVSSSKKAVAFLRATATKRIKAGKFKLEAVQELIRTLKRFRTIRNIYDMQQQINKQMEGNVDEEDIEKTVHAIEKAITEINTGSEKSSLTHYGKRQSTEDAKARLNKLLEFSDRQFISTGLDALDQHLHGFERGNLVTISAPRGGCKTMVGMAMSLNQYFNDYRNVCFVSMEMEEIELERRIVSNISQLEHDIVRYPKDLTDEQKLAIKNAVKKFHTHGVKNKLDYSIERPRERKFTPFKLETIVKPYKYDVILVDYITLFDNMGKDQWAAQMDYSRYLKTMASSLNCVVIALSQLSEEERVKYGKALEENTDYWIWWRWREDEEQQHGNVELRLAKARHAQARKFHAKFRPHVMTVETGPLVERQIREARNEKGGQQGIAADAELWGSR